MIKRRKNKMLSGNRKIELLLNRKGWSYLDIMEYFSCSQGKAYMILKKCKRNRMFPSCAIVESVLELEGVNYDDELKKAYLQAKYEDEIFTGKIKKEEN